MDIRERLSRLFDTGGNFAQGTIIRISIDSDGKRTIDSNTVVGVDKEVFENILLNDINDMGGDLTIDMNDGTRRSITMSTYKECYPLTQSGGSFSYTFDHLNGAFVKQNYHRNRFVRISRFFYLPNEKDKFLNSIEYDE